MQALVQALVRELPTQWVESHHLHHNHSHVHQHGSNGLTSLPIHLLVVWQRQHQALAPVAQVSVLM